jgi:hypothetical protein
MRPTTAHDDNIFDLNSLLHPGTAFEHPQEVVSIQASASRKSGRSWRPGHQMRPLSHRAHRCGRA